MEMKEYIESVIKPMCDYPEDVKVAENIQGDIIFCRADVNKKDIGKIIGIRGKNANAIRILGNSIAAKTKNKFFFEVNDK